MLVNSLSTTTASNAPIALPRTPERYGEPADWHTDPARDLGDRKVGLGYLTGPSVVRNAAGCVVERCPRHLLASAGFFGLGLAAAFGVGALMVALRCQTRL